MSGITPAPGEVAEHPSRPAGTGLVRNTVWTLLGRAAFMVGWALVTPALLSHLGVERFAIWALIYTFSAWMATFDLGLSQSLVRFVAEFGESGDRESLRALVAVGIWGFGILGAVAIAGIAFAAGPVLNLLHTPPALRAEASASLVGMAAVFALTNITGIGSAILTGRQRMDLTGALQLLGTIVQIGGVLIVLAAGGGLRALVWNAAISQVVTGLITWLLVRRILPGLSLSTRGLSPELFGRLLRFSGALQITNLGTLMQFQIDKVLLAHFVTLVPVTQFELGTRLATAAWLAPMLLLPPLVPAFARLATLDDGPALTGLYWRATRYLMAVGFPVAGLLVVAAPSLTGLWLGAGHAPVAEVTAVAGGFLLLTVLTGVSTAVLRGRERPWPEASYHVTGFASHLILSLLWVPRFGLRGALLAMLVSAFLSAGQLLVLFHRRVERPGIRWFRTAAWPLGLTLAGAGLAAAVAGTGWNAAPLARIPSLLRFAEQFAILLVVVVGGYVVSGYFPGYEMGSLVKAARASLGSAAPRKEPRIQ